MTDKNPRPEAEAVADIVRAAYKPELLDIKLPDGTHAPILLTPNAGGVSFHSVKKLADEYRTRPERRTGTAVLTDLASFIDHTKRFADEHSAIFADRNPKAPSLTTVFDYHEKTCGGLPRFGTHRAHYAFPISDEWARWTAQDGKTMEQAEFAAWIEDRLEDVADPSLVKPESTAAKFAELHECKFAGARRLNELAGGLSIHVGRRVVNKGKQSSGEQLITFTEDHSDASGHPLEVPNAFVLGLSVFRNGAPYQVAARLRYRLNGAQIVWWFNLHRTTAILEHAIDEACEMAAQDTKLPLFNGKQEGA